MVVSIYRVDRRRGVDLVLVFCLRILLHHAVTEVERSARFLVLFVDEIRCIRIFQDQALFWFWWR